MLLSSPEPQMMSSNCLFCQTKGPKPKDIPFLIQLIKILQSEKLRILTFEKLEPKNVKWQFLFNN